MEPWKHTIIAGFLRIVLYVITEEKELVTARGKQAKVSDTYLFFIMADLIVFHINPCKTNI